LALRVDPLGYIVGQLNPIPPKYTHYTAEFSGQGEAFLRRWLVPGALLGGLMTLVYLILPFVLYQPYQQITLILYSAVFATYVLFAAIFHFGQERINVNAIIFSGWTVVSLLSFMVMRITNDFTSASGILVLTVVAYAGLIPWPTRYTVYFFGLISLLYFSMVFGFRADDNWLDYTIYGILLLVVVFIFGAASGLIVHLRWQNFLNEQLIKEANNRLQEDLSIAKEIQQRLLPPSQPAWPHFDVACYSAPAREVGGDLYSYYQLNHDDNGSDVPQYAVAVGDVSGKGLPAALLMATSLAHLNSFIGNPLTPPERMTQMDQAMVPYTQSTGHNCALCYVELKPVPKENESTWQLCGVNAGCIPPYVKRVNGAVEWLQVGGVPLGIGLGANLGYPTVETHLDPGDMVILTSDGVPEANTASGEIFGFERLSEAIAGGPTSSAAAMSKHLTAVVKSFAGQTELQDDLTIVVVQLKQL
jgi:serine phosphatase RsbU (regulator of sigma subunit)